MATKTRLKTAVGTHSQSNNALQVAINMLQLLALLGILIMA